ncbi:MAG: hypothetical protein JW717_04395 [Marinilabiliaceae bacterium]|nr:hypothetical protein [Marinilabiliaceae bacterium]
MNQSLNDKDLASLRDILNDKLKGASFVESRLMGFEVLPRLILQLKKNGEACSECREAYLKTMQFVDKINLIVKPDNILIRKEFEKEIGLILKHLKKTHKIFPKGEMHTKILSISMAVAIVITFVYASINRYNFFKMIMLGWAIGVSIGFLLGKVYENSLRKQNRLF